MTNTTLALTFGTAAWVRDIDPDSMVASILATAYWAGYYSEEFAALKDPNMECIMFDNEDDARTEAIDLMPSLYAISEWANDDARMAEADTLGFEREHLASLMDTAGAAGTEIDLMVKFASSTDIGFDELRSWASAAFDFFGIDADDTDTCEALFALVEDTRLPAEV